MEKTIIFESQDHQGIMTLDSASKTLDSIALDGTIEGETIDALFKLKKSHPWYAKLHTDVGDVFDKGIDTHYWITFSKQETEDWMDGMWASGDGWTSHSNIVWRAK
jgi:hypothetical protein